MSWSSISAIEAAMATVWARGGGRRSTPGHERAEGTRGGNADGRHAQELHESALDDETTDEKTAARCEPPVNRRRARPRGGAFPDAPREARQSWTSAPYL
jgi:hypothetical protein